MTASMRPAGPTRQEFAERLLKGSVKKSYAPVVDIDWDAPLDPDKFFLPPKSVSLYGTPMWDADDPRAADRAVATGVRQHALGRHLVREHPEPGAAAQGDAPGSDVARHALRADRARRRNPPHGDVRQGDRTRRREAGAAAVVSARHHQRVAVGLQGIRALGGRVDRRGDLRLAAAADDGRRRTAANGAAAHADSRDRGSPAHPVRPRRPAEADAEHGAAHTGCGYPTSTVWAGCSSATCSPTRCRTTASGSTRARRGTSPAPASTVTRFRSRASPRWPPSSRRSA